MEEGDPPFRSWCSPKCAIIIAREKQVKSQRRAAARAKAKKKADSRAAGKALRDLNRRTLSWQHNLTQPVFNRMRVLEELKWFRDRGIEPYCISCGRTKMDWCCGHYKTVGAQSQNRYDPNNTFLQCNWRCNRQLSGNIHGDKTSKGMIQGILDRFGEDQGQVILTHCEIVAAPRKWQWEELEDFRARCASKIRALERER
jgi:hypothetical protein